MPGGSVDQSVLDLIQAQQTEIDDLTSRVTSLEGILGGLSNSDLTGALSDIGTLQGILAGVSSSDLTGALADISSLQSVLAGISNSDLAGALADINSVCPQVSTLTTQANSLRTVINGISLGGVIPLGLALNVPARPAALPAYSCP